MSVEETVFINREMKICYHDTEDCVIVDERYEEVAWGEFDADPYEPCEGCVLGSRGIRGED